MKKRILVLWFSFLMAAPALFGQFETAEVLGTVRDPSGAAIPDVAITLINQATGIKDQTTTGSGGSFDFFNVKQGLYTLEFERAGFSRTSTSGVKVNVNARQRVDVTMQVGAITETVSVSGVAAVLDTDSSEHSQVVSGQAITELPLNGRNYADLALLSASSAHLLACLLAWECYRYHEPGRGHGRLGKES